MKTAQPDSWDTVLIRDVSTVTSQSENHEAVFKTLCSSRSKTHWLSKPQHYESLTLICLFSSRSLWASICSLLHSSMIFLTSPSSRVEVINFVGSAEVSDFSKLDDIILLDSMSCWKNYMVTSYSTVCLPLKHQCFYGDSDHNVG